MLDHGEAPLGFIHRAGAAAANLLGMPGLGDQPLQALDDSLALRRQQVAVIQRRQLRGDGVVLLDQGAPRHLGGVGGEHQFDVQAAELARQLLRALPAGEQAFEQFVEHAQLEGFGFVGATPAHAVLLLGDIGQIEELVEGARHRQQLIVAELTEGAGQLFGVGGGPATTGLGALANAFDLVEELVAQLGADGLAQQLAKQVHFLTQTRIDFCHVALLLLTDVNRVPSAPTSYKGATRSRARDSAGSRLVHRGRLPRSRGVTA